MAPGFDPRYPPTPYEAPSTKHDEPAEADDVDERPHGSGSVGVDAVEAHMGATEEQIGDLTGPGAGYDEHRKR